MTLQQLGPYRIERLLGQGGMGAVYAAVDESTGAQVAVKAIPSAKSAQEVFQKRFGAETSALTKLQHPNIVRILAHGSSQGYLYLAMELVDGPSLYDYFRKKRFLPWAEVIGYMLDVCKGLKHAHDRGYIHRDLKLGNLLLASTGQVKIADFGIARYQGVVHDELREQITAPGGVVGTYDYMAPEQLRGEPSTVRSDLYSLGVVMYVLLTGRTPFSFKNVNEAIDLIRSTEITPVGNLAPDMPPRLEKLVMRLLAKDPAERFASADTVGRRLMEIIDGDADVSPQASKSNEEPSEGKRDDEDFELNDAVHQQQTLVDGKDEVVDQTYPPPKPTPPTILGHDGSQPTQSTASSPAAAPKPASRGTPAVVQDYFAPVTEQDRGDDAWRTEEPPSGPIWPYLLALLAVLCLLIAGFYYSVVRAPSADQLFAQLALNKGRGETPEQLEGAMREFVERFPNDPRKGEFEAALADLEARQLPRRLQNQLSWQNTANLTDGQRVFLEALRIAQTRPAEADQRLAAVEALLKVSPDKRDETLEEAIRSQRRILAKALANQLTDRLKLLELLQQQGEQLEVDNPAALQQWLQQVQAVDLLYREDTRLAPQLASLNELRLRQESDANSSNR